MKGERKLLLVKAVFCIVFAVFAVILPISNNGASRAEDHQTITAKGLTGPCLGDLDLDQDVDGRDLQLFQDYILNFPALADINGSGSYDQDDAEEFALELGRTDCPTLVFGITPVAIPSSGAVPLEVRFSANVAGGTPPYTFSWDLDGDGTPDEFRESFSYLFIEPGQYNIHVTVTDSEDGNVTADLTVIAMLPPEVRAWASPIRGVSPPMNVSFSCSASDPDGEISLYEWDFDGDGVFDWSSHETCDVAQSYNTKGAFDATVRVTDAQGLWVTDTVHLFVGSRPSVLASAAPMSGAAPLSVVFSARASDEDGTVTLYEWDFDGDGAFDWSSNQSADTTYTFEQGGVFNVTLRVTDDDGITSEDTVIISIAGPPVPLPSAYPLSGPAPLHVTFFADGEDYDGSPNTFQWDFNGDGVFDWSSTDTSIATYTYDQPGTYSPVLRVTDNQGVFADKALEITVNAPGPESVLTAVPFVSPPNGAVPLSVHLIGGVNAPDGPVCEYQWDFQGDGVYDWSENVKPAASPGQPPIRTRAAASPVFADLDGDGDYDMVLGGDDGKLNLYENQGTRYVPDFRAADQVRDSEGDIIDVGFHSRPAFGDIDGDGDLDLVIGSEEGTFVLYENRGDSGHASWVLSGQLMNCVNEPVATDYYSSSELADIDADGDLDLVSGDYFGQVIIFHNRGDAHLPIWAPGEPAVDVWGDVIDAGYYSAPRLVDVDGDGDLDLLLGCDSGNIRLYLNQGDSHTPVWEEQGELSDIHGQTIDVGYYSRPFFVDIDADRDLDLFAGTGDGGMVYFANTGSMSHAVWRLLSLHYNAIGTDYNSAPFAVDFDHDGDLDLVTGDEDGTIYYFTNEGNSTAPVWAPLGRIIDVQGDTLSVGGRSRPVLADIDGDGDYDLFIGSASGEIFWSRNLATGDDAAWHEPELLHDSANSTISPGANSKPFLADIDSDNDLDLIIGTQQGAVLLYRNDGSAAEPSFVNAGSILDIDGHDINVGSGSSPLFYDIDFDGDLDLFIGADSGKIFLFRNSGSPEAYLFQQEGQFRDSAGQPVSVSGNAVPAMADMDGDGDGDLVTGDSFGNITLFETTGTITHVYLQPGTYHPTLKVRECGGRTDSDSITIEAGPAGSPSAMCSSEPVSGTGPLDVSFTATATDTDGNVTLFEWDFDGDGIYDWSSSETGDVIHTYNRVGVFEPVLRVTDNEGKSIRQALSIRVEPSITASASGAVNIAHGVAGTITSNLGAGAVVTLRIVDQAGNTVRTILQDVEREAGQFTDSWDGLDDQGVPVRDGVYFFILEVNIDGKTWTYDRRKGAPYSQVVPNRSFPSSFSQYDDQFFPISYSLARPSAVSLYIRTNSSNGNAFDRVKTLLSWEYRSAGNHVEIWDGTDDRGVAVPGTLPTGVTLWAWELPESALVVAGSSPEVTDLSADPNYFSPAYNPYASDPNDHTAVSFTISEPCDVQAQVKDSEGLVIRQFTLSSLPEGRANVVWDGRNDAGSLVPAGQYTIGITAIDRDGNRSPTRYASVVLFY